MVLAIGFCLGHFNNYVDDDDDVTWRGQVREQMQAEIDKYKRETEEAVSRTIAEMKAALEARLKEKIQLENEKERVEALVAQLQGHVNELQAQVFQLFTSDNRQTINYKLNRPAHSVHTGTSFDGLMSFWFPATYGK